MLAQCTDRINVFCAMLFCSRPLGTEVLLQKNQELCVAHPAGARHGGSVSKGRRDQAGIALASQRRAAGGYLVGVRRLRIYWSRVGEVGLDEGSICQPRVCSDTYFYEQGKSKLLNGRLGVLQDRAGNIRADICQPCTSAIFV